MVIDVCSEVAAEPAESRWLRTVSQRCRRRAVWEEPAHVLHACRRLGAALWQVGEVACRVQRSNRRRAVANPRIVTALLALVSAHAFRANRDKTLGNRHPAPPRQITRLMYRTPHRQTSHGTNNSDSHTAERSQPRVTITPLHTTTGPDTRTNERDNDIRTRLTDCNQFFLCLPLLPCLPYHLLMSLAVC